MHDILDMVMMATTAMSKKNATIQENYFKSGTKELCMSAEKKQWSASRKVATNLISIQFSNIVNL